MGCSASTLEESSSEGFLSQCGSLRNCIYGKFDEHDVGDSNGHGHGEKNDNKHTHAHTGTHDPSSPPSLSTGLCSCELPSNTEFDLDQPHPVYPPYLGEVHHKHAALERIMHKDENDDQAPPELAVSESDGSDDEPIDNKYDHDVNTSVVYQNAPCGLFQESMVPCKSMATINSSSRNRNRDNQALVLHGVLVKGVIHSPIRKKMHSTIRHKRISTLPSTEHGKPIRLRITESYTSPHFDDPYASYDPYFSQGQYQITTANGSPYGDALSIQMSTDLMTLQQADGNALAVMRSRHTYEPSFCIYGSAPRYKGQRPSSLEKQSNFYPWALVKKEGKNIKDSVTVQFFTDGCWGPVSWRSKHGFVGTSRTHTHTVVTRVCEDDGTEKPCCLVIRDLLNMDALNVTIAPGIDPLLTICYLAVHNKMDVEPKLKFMEQQLTN